MNAALGFLAFCTLAGHGLEARQHLALQDSDVSFSSPDGRYTSPCIGSLDMARISWDLRGSGFRVSAEKPYDRAMEFRLTSLKAQHGLPRLIVGEFCFWPSSYIRRVGALSDAQLQQLAVHRWIYYQFDDESDCLVPRKGKNMYLGVRLYTEKNLPKRARDRLRILLSKVSLRQ